ncbi:DNA polymerase III (beta chain) DnaN_1 [Mycobacterium marinum M]|uniref:DNA polymerase III (Beta chain) DnaN_1 n=1 Tax=Mycobacterium marinum (strain ATCC BAA-535 / M) TaxID=216594 RepID=B2HPI2_MYCMM|nr:DNA polymerase III (subunit beta) DnaN [Mycobacterium marinum]ACC42334.1 DNA polymerase III (beta chain) DnaN_1 [Mycobacterium marinum M]
MKFVINSGTLAETIAAAISSLPTRPAASILGGVLVEAQLGTVTFSSFNYNRATTRLTAADVADTDTVVVAGRLLAAVGANLPKGPECQVTVGNAEMVIATPRTEFRLPVLHATDYPRLPVMGSEDAIGCVNAESFSEAVHVIGRFASTDALPAEFTALNIDCRPGQMRLCATDRYMIARREIEWTGAGEANINVPAADLLATIKAASGNGAEPIEILWNGATLGLRTPSTTVITRVLDEEFPNVDRVLSLKSPFHAAVTVPTAELASTLKRAASIADDQNAQIDVAINSDTLSVTTTQSTAGNIDETVAAVQHGGDRKIALSSRRLHNTLSAIDDPNVTLAFLKEGHMVYAFPGAIDTNLVPPQRDTVAALMGIKGREGQ